MAKLIWTQKAIESLEAIYDYISRDSIQYANYQTRKIVDSVERLSIFPESGKIITEFEQSIYTNAFNLQPYYSSFPLFLKF